MMTSPALQQKLTAIYVEALDVAYRRPDLSRAEVLARLDELEAQAEHVTQQAERLAEFGV